MKQRLAILLVLLLLLTACSASVVPTATPQIVPTGTAPTVGVTEEVTVTPSQTQEQALLTFCAMSDTHIGDTNAETSMERTLGYINSFEQKPQAYLFVGDLTNTTASTKSKSQINTFKTIYEKYGNAEQMLYCLGPTHDIPEKEDAAECREIFREALGEEYFAKDLQSKDTMLEGVRHIKINGFHFFSVDWEGKTQWTLPRRTYNWLKDEIAVAAAEDEKKPIFVISHVPGMAIDNILKEYPQVVLFTGHLHNSVAREDSISQDKGFTSIHCGGMNYYRVDGYNRFFEDPFLDLGNIHEFAQALYVQVDKDYNVTVKRLDGYNGAVIGQDWVIGEGRYDVYKSDRKDNAKKLTFDRYARLNVEQNGNTSVNLQFTQATAGDAGPAIYYKVELLTNDGNGYSVKEHKEISSRQVFYPNDQNMPAYPYSCSFTNVDLTDYAVVVTAYDCWNKSANALVYTNGSYSIDYSAGDVDYNKNETQSTPETGEITKGEQKISFNYGSTTYTSKYTKDYSMAVRFNPTYEFTDIYLRCSSWGDLVGTLEFTLYKWDTDYATTVAGEAVDTSSMSGYKGSTVYTVLDGKYQAGEYLLVITTPDYTQQVGLYHYPLASGEKKGYISYENGAEMSTSLYFGWTNTATCQIPYKIYP